MIIRCYCMYNICNSLTGRKSANHLFKVRAYHAHDEIHTGDLRSFTSVTTVDSCRTWFFSRVLMFYTFRPSSVLKAWWSNKHTGGLRDPPSLHLYCAKECLTVWQLPHACLLGFFTGGYSSRAVGGLRGGGGGLGAAVLPRATPLCGVQTILTLRVLKHLLDKRRHWSWNLHL